MAGDWLKMRHDLADDPAVIRLASSCGLDEFAVLGRLHVLWSWADRHTADGHADGLGLAWVDRKVRHDGFAVEMVRVGWLEETGSGLAFPRFDRHCSDTAKARALKKDRMQRCRGAARATEAPLEKRRVEVPPPPRARARGEQDPAGWETLRDAWKAGPGEPWTPPDPPDEAVERLSEPGWLDAALKAIARLRGCRYFDTPVGLHQFCGPRFVKRVNEGRYDTPKKPKGGKADPWQGDKPELQAAWTDADRKRFEATKRAMAAKMREAAT